MEIQGSYDAYLSFMASRSTVDGFYDFLLSYGNGLKHGNNSRKAFMRSGLARPMHFSSPVFLGAGLLKNLGVALTSSDGFLFGGITVSAPFNISVQRFGHMSLSRPDFWGARIGSNTVVNRTFAAIKPGWNPMTHFTTGVIPKGTPIKFGIVGPQGLRYPGGSFQFIVNSKNVINQSTRLIR